MPRAPVDPGALRDTPWHARTSEDVVRAVESDAARGLSDAEVRSRRETFGPNTIRSGDVEPWWRVLLHQVADPLIYILLVAAAVSVVIAALIDAAVILAVVVLNGAIGFVQELRARRAIAALAQMGASRATVVRDGEEQEVETETLVPGDVILLSSGDQVPADARLLDADELTADESALTGESDPVTKQVDAVEDERAVPGDQKSLVFAGTSITRGRGRGVVVRTGDASELGHIARTTQAVSDVKAPIQVKVERLARWIALAVLVLAALVIGGGVATGMSLSEAIRTAVALAVAAVPEGLPIVLTVTLAVGVQRMARRRAIIRALPAVETLGSTTVVGTDKTGTLTMNQMTTRVIWTGGRRFELSGSGYDRSGEIAAPDGLEGDAVTHPGVRRTLLAGVLANESSVPGESDEEPAGDPTELALLVAAAKGRLDPDETRRDHHQQDMIPFESERQFMATLNQTPDGLMTFLKGSPEAVLSRCGRALDERGEEADLDADAIRTASDRLADEGFRVLATAYRKTEASSFDGKDPGDEFTFAGLHAIEDPIRPEVPDAVTAATRAGIRILMLTGDHARTARAIGRQLRLGEEDVPAVEGRELEEMTDQDVDDLVHRAQVYARVSPDHKLKLVERLKQAGDIVAVTGDGVNDAPALQAAHLGIAMGRGGTDVAREAADMVLADDNFASITSAVEEGRVVFSNIRKVTYFLLSTGIGQVIAILSSLIGPWPLIFLPAQVLWINLVTNGTQDVALAFEKGEQGLLHQPPRRPDEGVINRAVAYRLLWIGLLVAVATLAVYWGMLRSGATVELSRSVAMTQIVLFQFFHVLNVRSFDRSIFKVPLRANPFLAISLPLALTAHVGALYLPFMQAIFETEPLSLEHWGLVTVIATSIVVAAEIDKALMRRKAQKRALTQP